MADLCPRCGAPDVEGDKCARCGVIASVYKASLEKMRRPPTLPAAAPTVDYGAAPPPSSPAATATAAWPLGGPSRGRKLTFHGSGGGPLSVPPPDIPPDPGGPRAPCFRGRGKNTPPPT